MIQTKARSYLLKTKYKYFHHEQRIIFYPHGLHFHLIQYILTPLISGFYHSLLPLLTSPPGYPVTSFNSHYTSPFTKIQFSWRRPSWKPLPNLTSQVLLFFKETFPYLAPTGETPISQNPEFQLISMQSTPTGFLWLQLLFPHKKFQFLISNYDLSSEFLFQTAKYLPDIYLPGR